MGLKLQCSDNENEQKPINKKVQKLRSFFHINMEMWRFKLHYFLYFGASGASTPFIPVYGNKIIGLSNTALAFILMTQHFLFIVLRPAIGYIADYFNKLKVIIMILICIQFGSYFLILTISRMENNIPEHSKDNLSINSVLDIINISENASQPDANDYLIELPNSSVEISVFCSEIQESNNVLKNETVQYFSQSYARNHLGEHNNSSMEISEICLTVRNLNCTKCNTPILEITENVAGNKNLLKKCPCFLKLHNADKNDHNFLNEMGDIPCILNDKEKNCLILLSAIDEENIQKLVHSLFSIQCNFSDEATYTGNTYSMENSSSMSINQTTLNIYKELCSYQFWYYAILFTVGLVCNTSVFTISDTACCESVQKFGGNFGHQRLWAAIGWGLSAPISGILNDCVDIWAAWMVMGFCLSLTMWNLTKMELIKPQLSQNIQKDIGSVLKSWEFFVFEIGLVMNGIGSALIWFYSLLFLISLGATKLLCGLTITVQSFLGTIPLMFFSEHIIRKLGHLNVVTLCLLMYAVRFIWYSYLYNPWLILIAEILHGFTYGLLYANIASFGKAISKPGTEATTQSVLFSTHEGLGVGLGCFLGGIGMDHIGGHMTFFIASLVSACGLVLHHILTRLVHMRKKSMEVTNPA